MNYQETTAWLFNATPVFEHIGASAYKPGLQTTEAIDAHYGHPHRRFRTIHVAGTNGKGSCSHTLAAVLQAAGYRVGLFTSPHLVDFRERIRVNGACISEEYVVRFVEDFIRWNGDGSPSDGNRADGVGEMLHPSFFELTTIMAFCYFAEQQVDVAVIEVGLGGRLDSTNIICPQLSLITNISMDHTQFLGHTLAEIAGEKAGIIKPHVPVVIGEAVEETKPVFEKRARQMQAPIFFAEAFDDRAYRQIDFELRGSYQQKNRRTILCALDQLRETLPVTMEHIAYGMAHVCEMTGLMGRWQRLNDRPLVVCDTGHNVGGWQFLAPQIAAQPCRQLRMVFGMVDDKDIDSVMAMLPKHAVYYWTQASTHRAIPAQAVGQKGLAHSLQGQCFATVGEAYRQALADAASDDFIFVGGSSYVVADLLSSV